MDYPKSTPGVGLVDGRFVDENIATGQPGSLIPAAWGNAVTTELLNVIQAAGYAPDEQDLGQLVDALRELDAKSIYDHIATQAEVDAGSETGKLVTPKTFAVALGKLWQVAKEDAYGVVRLATQAEVDAGAENQKVITPKTLAVALGSLWQEAQEAKFGVVKLATQAEVDAGIDIQKVLTPKTFANALASQLNDLWQAAQEATYGVVKLATQAEVDAGAETQKVVTPKTLGVMLGSLWKGATEVAYGVLRLATQAEVDAGSDTEKAVTPKTLAVKLGGLWTAATEAAFGVVKLATQAETNAGADDGKAVTSRKLRYGISSSFGSRGHFAFPSWAGGWIINWGLETAIPQAIDSASAVGPVRDVTLSLAYPNQGFGIVACMSFSTMATRSAFTPGAVLLSKSIARIQNNYIASPGDIFWISIGN